MRSYRCIFMNEARSLRDVEPLDCPDDLAATRMALDRMAAKNLRRATYTSIEVWDAARLVCAHPAPSVRPG